MNRLAASRVLLLTPSLDGADGISEVSRQTASACAAEVGAENVEVWSFRGECPQNASLSIGAFRSAGGRRSRLARWAIAQAARPADGLLAFALHLHLTPLGVPLSMRGARLACFLHGVEAWRPLRSRERASLNHAFVLANSAWTARRFKEANPSFGPTDVAVCHLGVRDPAEPVCPDRRGYALIVGRMSSDERYKGHDLLIDVWPDIERAVPGARLVIAGDGTDRPRLETRVAERGLAAAVTFAGAVSDAEREGLYRNAAFFVMPSAKEGFGLAYLEAMRARKACVAGIGAASEIITDGVEGVLVDPLSRPGLTNAIIKLFTDTVLRSRMEVAAAQRVHREFESSHFAERLIAGLARACEETAR